MTTKMIEGLNREDGFGPFHILEESDPLLEVKNPFSGVTAKLTPEAEAVYSYIKGTEAMGLQQTKQFRICLDWFRKHYPEAYMTLLD